MARIDWSAFAIQCQRAIYKEIKFESHLFPFFPNAIVRFKKGETKRTSGFLWRDFCAAGPVGAAAVASSTRWFYDARGFMAFSQHKNRITIQNADGNFLPLIGWKDEKRPHLRCIVIDEWRIRSESISSCRRYIYSDLGRGFATWKRQVDDVASMRRRWSVECRPSVGSQIATRKNCFACSADAKLIESHGGFSETFY